MATLLLGGIMLLALALHLYNIRSIGDANAYYTAAVESMLDSWGNFFFVAAEPGGSVTVDKPPLGLWIEAAFAFFLGVSGWSVSLPNILAGVLGVPLLYGMVKKHMGELAGLAAALVMTLTPVFVATNRNNTMDGMLVFFLLLAAWAFIRAAERGRAHWLMLGALILGLGFNIKMMQAFLPLPAFYALYFLGSREDWLRKLFHLGLATLVLLAVSLSWAVAVDLTPADERPYIGSSGDNTVMGLILGHNGASRLFGGFFGRGSDQPAGQAPAAANQPLPGGVPGGSGAAAQAGPNQGANAGRAPQEAITACVNLSSGEACSFVMPFGAVHGTCIVPPDQNQLTCAPRGMIPRYGQGAPGGQPPAGGPNDQGGTPFSGETGSPGIFRFFTQPLSKQMSWLLPFALVGMATAAFGASMRLPLVSGVHKALVLWGGWLLTCLVFFSTISGIFHAYYAIMLVPALAAMVGTGFTLFWNSGSRGMWSAVFLAAAAAATLAFQAYASLQYEENWLWTAAAGLLFAAGTLMLAVQRRLACLAILAAMLVIPAYWTVMTILSDANMNLPTAYVGANVQAGPGGMDRARQQGGGQPSRVNQQLLDYLLANTREVKYLVAVPSSQQGAPLVLASGRPVLYMGGFSGGDQVIDAEGLADMVANGELRFVLSGGERGGKQDIAAWLNSSCSIVPQFSRVNAGGPQAQGAADGGMGSSAPAGGGTALYLCR
jgi:4-amino-4-deoxy-L-arabinose transferase-like glycosyltransferase